MRRFSIIGLLGLLAFTAACTNKKVNNPLANVGSKQPDKVLFDRSMDAMKHNRFDVARITLQTLINTYQDSEYIARAKLAVADSWYAEGGSTAMQQAEIEYKDFKTFFPNMPEAAEAQLKVANIHYHEMEKADRDYTHAMRAEDEYRSLILEYPDSKLLPEAKQRLREVQEVLAAREFIIGRFYYLRQAYPAAIARLQTLVDRYPLYSGADETLYLLGQTYEAEIEMLRQNGKINEVAKSKMIEQFTKSAAEAYGKIITRYPAMDRALDAKARLEALKLPVPRPTRAAMEQNKREVASRHEPGMVSNVMGTFGRHPDVGRATRVGEPPLVDPKPVSATDVVQSAKQAFGGGGGGTENKLGVQTVNVTPAPNQEPPRSDTPPANVADPATPPAADAAATPPAAAPADPAQPPAAGELTPNVPNDANELKPNVAADPSAAADPNALPPPQQTNELAAGSGTAPASAASSSSTKADELVDISSSKGKKKKGLKKLNPF
jgi:outer membrane protein assembly factor BamD